MSVTIQEQADEVGREVRSRRRSYPGAIDRGRLLLETASRKLVAMEAAERTLNFMAQHADGLRLLCRFLMAASQPLTAPTNEQTDALLSHPSVRAVLEVWPDAEMHVLGPISYLSHDATDELTEDAETP